MSVKAGKLAKLMDYKEKEAGKPYHKPVHYQERRVNTSLLLDSKFNYKHLENSRSDNVMNILLESYKGIYWGYKTVSVDCCQVSSSLILQQ